MFLSFNKFAIFFISSGGVIAPVGFEGLLKTKSFLGAISPIIFLLGCCFMMLFISLFEMLFNLPFFMLLIITVFF